MSQNHTQKTLSILRVFALHSEPTLSMIMADTDLPKSTVMRHLNALKEDYSFNFKTVRRSQRRYYKVTSWGVFDPEFFRSLSEDDLIDTTSNEYLQKAQSNKPLKDDVVTD